MYYMYFQNCWVHDDVIKWKHFPRNWPFVRGIHRSPVNSPHKGQWRGALMFSLISVWINDWVNNGETGDLRRYRAHYDVIVMTQGVSTCYQTANGRQTPFLTLLTTFLDTSVPLNTFKTLCVETCLIGPLLLKCKVNKCIGCIFLV